MRRGPVYVEGGLVIGHRQDDQLGGFYLHQLEVIRRATLMERLLFFIFGRAPTKKIDPDV